MMRVITGSARGRRLATLEGAEVTRPTSESVKEAVFSMLQFELEGKKILDLFAGSGQLGIEALSRGAAGCTFVEADRSALEIVRKNVAACRFESQSTILFSDALAFLARREKFDIVFIDPPYRTGLAKEALLGVAKSVNDGGIVVCETHRDETMPKSAGPLAMAKEKVYGRTKVTVYRKDV